MLQSTSHSTAAQHGVTLPHIAANSKRECKPSHHQASANCEKLPSIDENQGGGMMSMLMEKKMGRTTSPSDLRVVVYDSLEQKRANKIGVKPLRNFNVTRSKRAELGSGSQSLPPIYTSNSTPAAPVMKPFQSGIPEASLRRSNTLAPFTTLAPKPTCGFYFNRETLNKKLRIGVPPSDLVKWRTDYSLFPQPQKQA